MRIGIAAGSCIWPRQYASSCFKRSESSENACSMHFSANSPLMFLRVKSARNLSFIGRLLSLRILPTFSIRSSVTDGIFIARNRKYSIGDEKMCLQCQQKKYFRLSNLNPKARTKYGRNVTINCFINFLTLLESVISLSQYIYAKVDITSSF